MLLVSSGSGRKHRHSTSQIVLQISFEAFCATPLLERRVVITLQWTSIRAASRFLIFRRNSAWETNAFIVMAKCHPYPKISQKA